MSRALGEESNALSHQTIGLCAALWHFLPHSVFPIDLNVTVRVYLQTTITQKSGVVLTLSSLRLKLGWYRS